MFSPSTLPSLLLLSAVIITPHEPRTRWQETATLGESTGAFSLKGKAAAVPLQQTNAALGEVINKCKVEPFEAKLEELYWDEPVTF